jgi:hypothetical protein
MVKTVMGNRNDAMGNRNDAMGNRNDNLTDMKIKAESVYFHDI